ncbi:MAG: hypothetical protein ACOC2E_01310 [Bacteroidota bacterium]
MIVNRFFSGIAGQINVQQRFIFVLFYVMTLALISCSNQKQVPTRAMSLQKNEPAAQLPSAEYFIELPETAVSVRSTHSTDSLWIEIVTNDFVTIQSMIINGVSVWVDPKAETNETYGISFPAARAQMIKRYQQNRSKGDSSRNDSVAPPPFEMEKWVELMKKQRKVVKDKNGTMFDDENLGSLDLSETRVLTYLVRFSWEQLGIEPEEKSKISIGVISESPQLATQDNSQQQSMAPRDPYGRTTPRRPPPQQDRPQRMALIPVKGWIAFYLDAQTFREESESVPESKSQEYPYE